jgi:glycosyltransferase involved in cell wall biosynthesis
MGSQELATTTYANTAWKCGITDNVHYLGYVTDEQLKALYQRALCFAFPSLWEGFGLPVLEAYSLSCPVLASKRTAIPETAGLGALLVDPESVPALAEGLVKACSPAFRRHAVPLGRRELKRFSWKRAARQTLTIYCQAAGLRA